MNKLVLKTDCFEYYVFYLFIFHLKVYNKRVIDIEIRFKKWGLLSLRMKQTRTLHLFDPDRDSSDYDFLDIITISITLLTHI